MAVFWVVAPCSLVEFYRRFGSACTRRRSNLEDSHLHTRRLDNLKSQIIWIWLGGYAVRIEKPVHLREDDIKCGFEETRCSDLTCPVGSLVRTR
jgi:hypothetical protein